MGLKNYLPSFLFKEKSDEWVYWKKFAEKYNFFYSQIEDGRPIMRGMLGGRSLSIEAVVGQNSVLHTKIKSPINNHKGFYLLIEDKKIIQNFQGIFDKKIKDISNNPEFEKKYSIKSNSEFFSMKMLEDESFLEKLTTLENISIEIHNFEITFTVFNHKDFGKSFIDSLKIYLEFLSKYDELCLQALRY